jgi:hypothetical protein
VWLCPSSMLDAHLCRCDVVLEQQQPCGRCVSVVCHAFMSHQSNLPPLRRVPLVCDGTVTREGEHQTTYFLVTIFFKSVLVLNNSQPKEHGLDKTYLYLRADHDRALTQSHSHRSRIRTSADVGC